MTRRIARAASLAVLLGMSGAGAQAQDGVEEILPPTFQNLPETLEPPWLSDTVTRPHANVATSVERAEITVLPLDAVELDAVGLLPRSITGLPSDLWGDSDTATLVRLFRAQPSGGLPAVLSFTQTLALAELAPPAATGDARGELFLARLDMLLARGALDPALALMERAGPTEPQVFRRFFDVSLLTGQGDRACAAMEANPDIAPTFPARIFCLARTGDWSAAALSLGTGEALGRITPEEGNLIARFLDPELFQGEPRLPPDPNLTPLAFQMRMAVAERPDLTGAPLAFVHADLSLLAGWRAQLDAAERLTRSGAIEPQQWFAIYTARVPSASGGVWDRVAAVQALDAALLAGDAREVDARLAPAFAHMRDAGLSVAFATIFAERLQRVALGGEAARLARRIGLLSPIYERVAQAATPGDAAEAFAFDVARGRPAAPAPSDDPMAVAVANAFSDPLPAHRYTWFVENDRMGEAFLRAALVLGNRESDYADISDALALFRGVGLEDLARRASLQLLLAEG
ncbi:hypothetical protein P6F26_08095 [Roseibacterium sp. SDUM158017]|uniref:hypothetical protein n=1 Tax=Roseicyclus salinarum TaxID=3036773 RepID=UPI002414EAC8|nr:hypothetical protein [Roseibacterium sp. SDUM158017]MDG4648403.1 hypothetical protein [Roseibacterium sp. SDUM158017]